MSDSMFGSLLNMLDKHTVGEVANALGQPQTSVARAMESSIATMLGGIASKSEDSGALQKMTRNGSAVPEPYRGPKLPAA